jgi:hypothetical protein
MTLLARRPAIAVVEHVSAVLREEPDVGVLDFVADHLRAHARLERPCHI